MTLWLGLDVGTQSTKGVVIDDVSKSVVARSSSPHSLMEGLAEGAAEQHPDQWLTAIRQVCADLRSDLGHRFEQIGGMAVSGQQHGLVLLDKDGQVLRAAKLWCDTETVREAEDLERRWGATVPVGFTASKVEWVRRHEPGCFAQVASVLLPKDYINFILTGVRGMDAGDASGTSFFDPVTREYMTERLDDLGIASRVPPITRWGTWLGTVTSQAAHDLGLREGLPVATGSGDNMMSALGAGATTAGVCVLSLGTSGTIFTHADQPVVDPGGWIAPFCGATGSWLPLLCVMNLTLVTEEVRGLFMDHESLGTHDALTDLARQVAPGSEGLMFLPYLSGERVPPLPTASGTLHGVRVGRLSPGSLYRAAIEGTSLNLGLGWDRLRNLGVEGRSLRLVGGAARNSLWRQVLADVLEVRVGAMEELESAALGAALLALWTAELDAKGDADITALSAPYLGVSATTEPTREGVSSYATLKARFADLAEQTHGPL